MKLPALWIVAAFAAGIAIATRWPGPLKLWLTAAVAAMLSRRGACCGVRKRVAAWVLALVAWAALGGARNRHGTRPRFPQITSLA